MSKFVSEEGEMTVVMPATDEEVAVQSLIDRFAKLLSDAGEDPDEPFVGEIPEEED